MVERGPSTQDNLSTIVEGFDDFETEMKIGTRHRRELDERRIAELKAEMKRLDNELNAEVKRRTDMNRSTQMWFEQSMSALTETFESTLNDRYQKTENRLNVLNIRIENLNFRFENEKNEIIELIEQRGRELKQMLHDFKNEFEYDKMLRLVREETMIEQLENHEQRVNLNNNTQIECRERLYEGVLSVLEDNLKLGQRGQESAQRLFSTECHRLNQQAITLAKVREHEDDEIVEALNRYTLKLQSSLRVINSTDM